MASIEHRPSGPRVVWRQDGAKQTERFANLAAAEDFRRHVEAHSNRWPRGWTRGVGYDEAPSTSPTFRVHAERCVKSRATAGPRCRDQYRRDLERHVYPTLGDTPVDRITPEDVGSWLIRLSETPRARRDGTPSPTGRVLSQKTIKNIHGLCSSIMAEAVDQHLAPGNPFHKRMRALPAVRTEEMTFLTRGEYDTLQRHVPEHYRPLVATLFLTGLRWSEATALRVVDVDLLARRLSVVQAWKRTPDNWFVIGEPKSRRSRRTITLPPSLVDVLVPLVAGRKGSEYVFTTVTGRPVRHANFYDHIWKPAVVGMQADGVDKALRIHDARHSHASWLIAAGVALPVIQRRLGHESITTSIDRYGHLLPDADDQVATALDGALEPDLTPLDTPPPGGPYSRP